LVLEYRPPDAVTLGEGEWARRVERWTANVTTVDA
jgi:hypothetical protein